jgi:hypothetical protein
MMEINIGDVLEFKSQHPCGGREFLVVRIGDDVVIKCERCGALLRFGRKRMERKVKSVRPEEGESRENNY